MNNGLHTIEHTPEEKAPRLKCFAVKDLTNNKYDLPLYYYTTAQAEMAIARFLDTEVGSEINSKEFELHYLSEYCNETGRHFIHEEETSLITNLENLKLPTKESK